MKFIITFLLILSSLILAGCENNNVTQNEDQNFQNDNNSNTQSGENAKRLSYQEYVDLYDINENNDVDNVENSSNNENDSTNINNASIPSNQLATYSTPLLSKSEERVNNIKIVCDRLNNFILNPHESFSYNDELGPYGPDDGFEEATILLSNGKKAEGYGGGVCQLSSTLYNVVKDINNVEITERHHHSAPVAYVPKGQDATVSLQSNLDFKFTNNNDYAIRFKAECENNKVTVWAFKES